MAMAAATARATLSERYPPMFGGAGSEATATTWSMPCRNIFA
jgi:hypothetical protein